MPNPEDKDLRLRNLILAALAIHDYKKTDLCSVLCMGYRRFKECLAHPQLFSLAELRVICRELDLNMTEVRHCI